MGHFSKFIFVVFSITCAKITPFPLLTTFFKKAFRRCSAPFLLIAILRRLGQTFQQVGAQKTLAELVDQLR